MSWYPPPILAYIIFYMLQYSAFGKGFFSMANEPYVSMIYGYTKQGFPARSLQFLDAFTDHMSELSAYDTGETSNENDRILTLITCMEPGRCLQRDIEPLIKNDQPDK